LGVGRRGALCGAWPPPPPGPCPREFSIESPEEIQFLNRLSMRGLLILFLVYVVMFLGWTGVGLLMLLAPARFSRLVHDNAGVFPQFGSSDWGKKLIVRLIGGGLLAFASWFAIRVADLIRQSN
jgi:hypothetical protein